MEAHRLDEMTRGWFVGDFSPAVRRLAEVEVGVKRYRAGDTEPCHVHRVATEITVIVDGAVEMAGRHFAGGDIVVLHPGEPSAFKALADTVTVVVKLPSVAGDKYPSDGRP
jgi:hypothetical protein